MSLTPEDQLRKAQLAKAIEDLNTAISKYVAGERLHSYTVGSGEFQRRYTFAEITLDDLNAQKDTWLKELTELLAKEGRRTYKNSHSHISWCKGV